MTYNKARRIVESVMGNGEVKKYVNEIVNEYGDLFEEVDNYDNFEDAEDAIMEVLGDRTDLQNDVRDCLLDKYPSYRKFYNEN